MTAIEYITLGISLYGAGLATALSVSARRRRLVVSADWGVARLGQVSNNSFFIVEAVNVGGRAVTVTKVEWLTTAGDSVTLKVFRQSKDRDLPVKIEPDEHVQVLFDPDAAARAIAGWGDELGLSRIRVAAAGSKRTWDIDITTGMREQAHELIEDGRAHGQV